MNKKNRKKRTKWGENRGKNGEKMKKTKLTAQKRVRIQDRRKAIHVSYTYRPRAGACWARPVARETFALSRGTPAPPPGDAPVNVPRAQLGERIG